MPVLAALAAPMVAAHAVGHADTRPLWQAWAPQAWLWALWLTVGALAGLGIARLWRGAGVGAGLRRWEAAGFALGWLATGAAVLSPLDALGEQRFWLHMVQHEVLMLVAAPLLVLGRPLAALVWGLPQRWRSPAARWTRQSGLQALVRVLGAPLTAWWLHAVVLWAWHAPVLFEAAVRHDGVHDLQHLSFFISALLFWWGLFQAGGGRSRQGVAVFYLFTTALHTAVLGALLTMSERLWYPVYAAQAAHGGLSALEDQQLGGLIMWVPGGVVYMVAALVLFARWMDAARTLSTTSPGG
ncbi:cytochrome c oxidase assembly protein [Azohydromonas sp. G-1-1-14]|uniref:Cytochrome c oxidase assembly protein n=1 Tax=Azohydromonas caseinilytica TaxID=2728836 RepID=A0A848FHH5_9BURK|nr:cytochrome c oxidase assembly protein [Azohydromonas caseinilytica]